MSAILAHPDDEPDHHIGHLQPTPGCTCPAHPVPVDAALTFRAYLETSWMPQHVVEAVTRQNYTYVINKRLLPYFGDQSLPRSHPAPYAPS